MTTVLLVDDDDGVLSLSQRILERAGFDVLTAASGEQALSVAAEHQGPIEVLVTDQTLPDLDVRELERLLSECRPGLKVLVVSGYPMDAAGRPGRPHFLQKPFSPKTLVSAVRDAMRR